MKFLMIASYPDSILNFRGPLINAVRECGMQVHVAAPDLPINSLARQTLERRGFVVHEIPLKRTGTNPLADLRLLWHLFWLMQKLKPTVVLGYTIKPVIYGSLAACLARVPRCFALVTGLGYAFMGESHGIRKLLRVIIQRLYRVALSSVDKTFFQNTDDQMLFKQLGILRPNANSFVVNGSGIDLSIFTPVRLPETTQFLLIARLLGDKGVREYAQAAQHLKAKYPDLVFSLAGWIDENPDAINQQELDSWVDKGHIQFLGHLSDVCPAITECSVYVLPSYREGTPRTVLEAMAMGRAIITTDAPGCRETVIDGDNGFLVSVKSVDELVRAMERFITEPELAQRMGARSRIIAEEKYDVHQVNAVMLKEMGIQ